MGLSLVKSMDHLTLPIKILKSIKKKKKKDQTLIFPDRDMATQGSEARQFLKYRVQVRDVLGHLIFHIGITKQSAIIF